MSGAAPSWSVGEREDFFAAIARHRAQSWRVTAAVALGGGLLAVVVALLLAPLLFGLLVLALDLLNFAWPMPDLFQGVMDALDPLLDDATPLDPARLARVLLLAALPGLLAMATLWAMLRRMLGGSALFDAGDAIGRAPRAEDPEEQRFANTVAEMAIAAQLPPPRVRVVDAPIGNAAVFGRDEAHATVVVGEGLLATLGRAQMQGVAAHLVGAVANGDLRIGLRAAVLLAGFGIVGRMALAVTEPAALRPLLALPRLALQPRHAGATALALELAQPFTEVADDGSRPATPDARPGWRDYARLPLMGPLAMTGFFGAIIATFALTPLLAFAWRQRKYLADASAVRLTRDPQSVADALQALAGAPHARALAAWADHAAVVPGGTRKGLLGGALVPMFPALARRLVALRRLGAQVELASGGRRGLRAVEVLVALLGGIAAALMGVVLVLLVWVSLMLSMLFTWLPVGLASSLLRWLAG